MGRKGSGSFRGRPCPEIPDDWNLRRQALCALEPRVSVAAPQPAHPWPRRGLPGTSSGLNLHPRRSELTQPSLRVLMGLEGAVAVFLGQAHGAAMAKWRTTPDQDQRKRGPPGPPAPCS